MNKIIVLLITVFFTACLYGQEKIKIAVFETQGTASAAIREELKNAIVDGLRNNSGIIVLERSALSQVMKEQGLQMSDDFNESQAVEVGNLAGASYICVSSINSANDFEYRIVYRLVDVKTGATLTSDRKKAVQNNLYDVFDEIAKSKLFAQEENDADNSICGCEIQKQDLPEGTKIPSGWRLPNLAELKCMCENKDKIGSFNFGVYTSSKRSRGHSKGIKFQFCEEVFIINDNASIRLVRSRK
jgi:TolB-like protein